LSGEKDAALRVMNTAVKYMVCLVAPFTMMVTILNEDYTRMLLGKSYMNSSVALAILIWSIFLLCLHTIPTYALNAARYTKTVTLIYGINIVVNIGLNLLFIPSLGYIGTSIINLLCNVIVVLYIFYMVNKKIGRPELPGNLLRISAAFIPQIIFMLSLKGKMNFILLSAAGVAVFAAAILLTGYFNPRDFEILKNIVIRRKKQEAQ
jgi:O-antigen/teichoic acid export membrane protein